MTSMEQICENFIGRSAENETNTGKYETEYKYIEWLIINELGVQGEYTEEELDAVFEKYCAGYKVYEFLKE